MEDSLAAGNDSGLALCRSAVNVSELQAWTSKVNTFYQRLEAARAKPGTALTSLIPPSEKFSLTASSVTVLGALSISDLGRLLYVLAQGPVGAFMASELTCRVVCDLDQSWVRRQYAPAHYPRFHAPHGWHQDGALGFDFADHPTTDQRRTGLLRMATCWIPLTVCGLEAPGLELIQKRVESLFQPAELPDEKMLGRFPPEVFWRPVLHPGDALLFRGDLLHRTHVTPRMRHDRSSIELRFFPGDAIPERLKQDRFIFLDSFANGLG